MKLEHRGPMDLCTTATYLCPLGYVTLNMQFSLSELQTGLPIYTVGGNYCCHML